MMHAQRFFRRKRLAGTFGLIAMIGGGLAMSRPAATKEKKAGMTLVVRAPRALKNAIVSIALTPEQEQGLGLKPAGTFALRATDGSETLPAQTIAEDSKTRLTFIVPNLPQGEKSYEVSGPADGNDATQVKVAKQGPDMEVHVGEALFTRYATQSGPNKPFLYPILAPDGTHFTRRYPMEQAASETNDHPHHRGLWFTHGDVNGIDFWSESDKAGRTKNREFLSPHGGPVYGGFQAVTEWRKERDKESVIAVDYRTIRVFPLPNGDRLMDFEIRIKPHGGPLTFGDTKEGMFGLRVPDEIAVKSGKGGQMLDSEGRKNGDIWGKKAKWVDYYGPINGKTYGIAIFDHPGNLRHPQTWHARDYGLFCANPFGLHDFKLGAEGAGNHTVPENGEMTLRYRLLFHQGDTNAAAVAEHYANYANPPKAEIK